MVCVTRKVKISLGKTILLVPLCRTYIHQRGTPRFLSIPRSQDQDQIREYTWTCVPHPPFIIKLMSLIVSLSIGWSVREPCLYH